MSRDIEAAEARQDVREVTICVDADGGDDAPKVVADGVLLALAEDPALKVVLVGRESSVAEVAAEFPDRIEPVITTEIIDMSDHPAQAVRQKKDSSIVVGCKLVHEGRADGFFSAGSTGGCLTAATVLIGRLKGVARPAIATVLPAPGRPVVLLDCGANADCKPEYLLQFAHMGRAYSECFLGTTDPQVGLLNNGTEETKGSELAIAAHQVLAEQLPSFVGNVEAGGMLSGACDVAVTDGFSGNIALKTLEGTANLIFKALKQIMTASLGNKLAGAKLKGDLKKFKDTIDPDVYGGAPLLGIRSVCIIGHGSSNAEAIKNGIKACAKAVRDELPQRIGEAIAQTAETAEAAE